MVAAAQEFESTVYQERGTSVDVITDKSIPGLPRLVLRFNIAGINPEMRERFPGLEGHFFGQHPEVVDNGGDFGTDELLDLHTDVLISRVEQAYNAGEVPVLIFPLNGALDGLLRFSAKLAQQRLKSEIPQEFWDLVADNILLAANDPNSSLYNDYHNYYLRRLHAKHHEGLLTEAELAADLEARGVNPQSIVAIISEDVFDKQKSVARIRKGCIPNLRAEAYAPINKTAKERYETGIPMHYLYNVPPQIWYEGGGGMNSGARYQEVAGSLYTAMTARERLHAHYFTCTGEIAGIDFITRLNFLDYNLAAFYAQLPETMRALILGMLTAVEQSKLNRVGPLAQTKMVSDFCQDWEGYLRKAAA